MCAFCMHLTLVFLGLLQPQRLPMCVILVPILHAGHRNATWFGNLRLLKYDSFPGTPVYQVAALHLISPYPLELLDVGVSNSF